jgi:hypothetical protein
LPGTEFWDLTGVIDWDKDLVRLSNRVSMLRRLRRDTWIRQRLKPLQRRPCVIS